MDLFTWPEFLRLPENRGLDTESARRRYMWYLHFAPRGGGGAPITTNLY